MKEITYEIIETGSGDFYVKIINNFNNLSCSISPRLTTYIKAFEFLKQYKLKEKQQKLLNQEKVVYSE